MRTIDSTTGNTSGGLRSRWVRRLSALAIAIPLSTSGVLALGELAASAHTTAIRGTAVCNTQTGTYSVHWIGDTDLVPANDYARVEIVSHSPAASSVPATPLTTTLLPNASYSFDQTGIPGNAGTASVGVHIYWTPQPGKTTNTSTFDAPATGSVVNLPPCSIPEPPVVQTLAGHIYLCPTTATTTDVAGGTLAATGAQTVASQANPLTPTNVAAGGYTMTAGVPAGYTFVACDGNAVINDAATSATESLTVPAGGSAVGIFYVRQIPPPPPVVQQLAGHIYLCPTTATTTEVTGGTLGATGAQTVATQANPLPLGNVSAGGYTMSATAPTGYTFVACGGNAVINQAGDAATETLTVPAGGSATGIFYVRQVPPPVTCPAGTTMVNGTCVPPVTCPAGTTMVNGTCQPPVVIPPVVCPAGTTMVNGTCQPPVVIPPVVCPSGNTMGANGTCVAPVVCPEGTSMTEAGTCSPPVVVPPVGPCPVGTTMNAEGVCAPNVISGGDTGGATAPVIAPVAPPKKPVQAPVAAPAEAPAALPFTGSNTGTLVEIALLMILVGGGLIVATRKRSDFGAPITR